MPHDSKCRSQGLEGFQRYERWSALKPRTIGWVAHPARQGPKEAWAVFHKKRSATTSSPTVAGAQHPAEQRVPRVLDPKIVVFVCSMFADLGTD